jgi:hypothetical protein
LAETRAQSVLPPPTPDRDALVSACSSAASKRTRE